MWTPDPSIIITAEQKAAEAHAARMTVTLSPRQLLLAALSIGISETDIVAMIDAIEDAETRAVARIEWQKATTYDRYHWLVEELREAMEFEAAEFDALWLWAAEI